MVLHTAVPHPGDELDYVEITSDVSLSGTSEGTADTVVTGTSIDLDGSTVILVTFESTELATHPSAGAAIVVLLYDGGTLLGRLGVTINPAAGSHRVPLSRSRRLTPSNGSHQYIVKAYQSGSGGAPYVGAGAGGTGTALPAFIRVTRVTI